MKSCSSTCMEWKLKLILLFEFTQKKGKHGIRKRNAVVSWDQP